MQPHETNKDREVCSFASRNTSLSSSRGICKYDDKIFILTSFRKAYYWIVDKSIMVESIMVDGKRIGSVRDLSIIDLNQAFKN